MTTTTEALQALVSELESAAVYAAVSVACGTNVAEANMRNLDAARAALASALAEVVKDADNWRWLRDLKCNSFTLGRDDDHACNYMTASDWIDNNPDWFRDDDSQEIERMRATNTIWNLQVYPNTPVGFNAWNASTLDAVVLAARSAEQKGV